MKKNNSKRPKRKGCQDGESRVGQKMSQFSTEPPHTGKSTSTLIVKSNLGTCASCGKFGCSTLFLVSIVAPASSSLYDVSFPPSDPPQHHELWHLHLHPHLFLNSPQTLKCSRWDLTLTLLWQRCTHYILAAVPILGSVHIINIIR